MVKQEQVMDKAMEVARQILVSQHLGGTDREGICNNPAGNTSGTAFETEAILGYRLSPAKTLRKGWTPTIEKTRFPSKKW